MMRPPKDYKSSGKLHLDIYVTGFYQDVKDEMEKRGFVFKGIGYKAVIDKSELDELIEFAKANNRKIKIQDYTDYPNTGERFLNETDPEILKQYK